MENMSTTVVENRRETPMQAMPVSGDSDPCNVNAVQTTIIATGSSCPAILLIRFAATE